MVKVSIIFIVFLSLCGCASTRAVRSARESIAGLERITAEQESRNLELEELLESERAGNAELAELLSELQEENDRRIEAERLRIEEKREFIGSLELIFSRESEITDKLIEIHKLLRAYFETQENLE